MKNQNSIPAHAADTGGRVAADTAAGASPANPGAPATDRAGGARWSRRRFLGAAAATAAGATAAGFCPRRVLAAGDATTAALVVGPDIPIALQLYSVRNDCKENFDAALARVAQLGFKGVEFAGFYQYADKPGDLKKRLDACGLAVAGAHLSAGALRGDALARTVDFHRALGCKFLIVSSDKGFTDPEQSKALAELFNQAAATLTPLGMFCGFHNHRGEFAPAPAGKTYWDLFAERTRPEVVLQQDIGWSTAAGQDPVALVKRYPGRTKTAHFKAEVTGAKADPAKKPIIGQDSVPWAEVIAACRAVGGTEWFIIEQEKYPDGKTPFECSALSLAGLKEILVGIEQG